eukprot:EG_transcript_3236
MDGFRQGPLWRYYHFSSPEVEQQFQEEYHPSVLQACRLWALTQIASILILPMGVLALDKLPADWLLWPTLLVPPVVGAALLVLCSVPRVPAHWLHPAVALGSWVEAGWVCWQLVSFFQFLDTDVLGAFRGGLPVGLQGAADRVMNDVAGLAVTFMFFFTHLMQQEPLVHLGFCRSTILACASGPVLLLVLLHVLSLPAHSYIVLIAALAIVAIQLHHAVNVSVLRRSVFSLERQRTHTVNAMQKADRVIGHLLKNTMVEAAAHVESFLDASTPEGTTVSPLRCAMERLRCGMGWVQRRKVVIALLSGQAVGAAAPVLLSDFGASLASYRQVATSFPTACVQLDEALCGLMLENAITNAFGHGHPDDPDVTFSITISNVQAGGHCHVTFRVSNRTHPDRPRITAPLVATLLDDASKPLQSTPHSEGLGLKHSFLAAQLQGMAASLHQEGDRVVFQAELDTRLVPGEVNGDAASVAESLCCPGPSAFPDRLNIVLLDDSVATRRLLTHQLQTDLAPCTVQAFGGSAADVTPFLRAALTSADIVILDQHLDWDEGPEGPSGELCLGTQLAQFLRLRAFRGLICIRSSSASEEDVLEYLQSGAHCVLDKLLDRRQFIAGLRREWARFARLSSASGNPPGLESVTSPVSGPCLVTPMGLSDPTKPHSPTSSPPSFLSLGCPA